MSKTKLLLALPIALALVGCTKTLKTTEKKTTEKKTTTEKTTLKTTEKTTTSKKSTTRKTTTQATTTKATVNLSMNFYCFSDEIRTRFNALYPEVASYAGPVTNLKNGLKRTKDISI